MDPQPFDNKHDTHSEVLVHQFGIRKNGLIINKKFQLKFVAIIFGYSLLVWALAYASITYFNLTLLTTSLSSVFLMTVGGLFLSRKIAGPLYKTHSAMIALGQGHFVKDIKFRKNDFFPEFVNALNQQMSYISGLKKQTKETETVSGKVLSFPSIKKAA
ncbi:MAG: hypothetical protein WCG27_00280 [Pseudomonadota bacterium]